MGEKLGLSTVQDRLSVRQEPWEDLIERLSSLDNLPAFTRRGIRLLKKDYHEKSLPEKEALLVRAFFNAPEFVALPEDSKSKKHKINGIGDIAKILGMSPNSINSLIQYGNENLEKEISVFLASIEKSMSIMSLSQEERSAIDNALKIGESPKKISSEHAVKLEAVYSRSITLSRKKNKRE